MDPENNNLDWFGNLCLQVNDFLAEASAVIPQEPIQQAHHQFTVVRERFRRIYAELLEDLPIFLGDGSEKDASSYPEEEQVENGFPPLTNSNISSAHNFQEGGIKGVDSSIPSLPVETVNNTDGVLSSEEGATGTPRYIAENLEAKLDESIIAVEGDVQNTYSSVYSEEEEGVAPENVETELEFHGSVADPYVQAIIASNISNWVEDGLKPLDSSSPLPFEAEDETNGVLSVEEVALKKVETELGKDTISVLSHEHCADSNVQETDVSLEEKRNMVEDEDSSESDIESYLRDIESYDYHSDWSITDEEDSSDSDIDSDSDSRGFSYDADSDSNSHSDWFILDDESRVTGTDWNMVD